MAFSTFQTKIFRSAWLYSQKSITCYTERHNKCRYLFNNKHCKFGLNFYALLNCSDQAVLFNSLTEWHICLNKSLSQGFKLRSSERWRVDSSTQPTACSTSSKYFTEIKLTRRSWRRYQRWRHQCRRRSRRPGCVPRHPHPLLAGRQRGNTRTLAHPFSLSLHTHTLSLFLTSITRTHTVFLHSTTKSKISISNEI